MIKKSIAHQLIALTLGISIIIITLLGTAFYYVTQQALINRTFEQLKSIRSLKAQLINKYFEEQAKAIEQWSNDPQFLNGVKKIITQPTESKPRSAPKLDSLFILASLNSDRSQVIPFEKIHQQFPVKDILGWALRDTNAKLLYLTANHHLVKEKLLKSVAEQPYWVPELNNPHQWLDFQLIGEDLVASTVFINLPLPEGQNVQLVVVFSNQGLDSILSLRSGFGISGETYIVGSDYFLRTNSRFYTKPTAMKVKAKTNPAQAALLNNESGIIITEDYRKVSVLSAYAPLRFKFHQWALLTEIDHSEVLIPLNTIRNRLVWISSAMILGIFILTWWFSKRITRPVLKLKQEIDLLSEGDLSHMELKAIERKDEIGAMLKATQKLKLNMHKTAEFAQNIGKGNFKTQHEPLSSKDILGNTLIQMQRDLAELYDITQKQYRTIAQMALKELEDEKQAHKIRTSALFEGQDKERRRIAVDLHDGVGQMMTALKLFINRASIPQEEKQEILLLVDEMIQELRRVLYDLMPAALIDFGLEAALRQLTQNICQQTGLAIEFTFRNNSSHARLAPNIESSIYRIVQEGINNCLKHAQADLLRIAIEITPYKIELFISDNGIGIEDAQNVFYSANGLEQMKNRLMVLGGNLELLTQKGKGLTIKVVIPI